MAKKGILKNFNTCEKPFPRFPFVD